MSDLTLIEHCAIATVNDDANVIASGYLALDGNRIAALGTGAAPDTLLAELADTARNRGANLQRVNARGMLATPGLVNTHHHMFQWLTRGIARESILFDWLVELYPTWAHIDDEAQAAAARAAMASLLLSGCTMSTDHHYLHPQAANDLLAVEVEAAAELGMRFHPCRGSMDVGESSGGLPPDHVVEDLDAIMAASETALDRWHDPAPDSMLQIALAPCSPFTVSEQLLRDSAALARSRGVRLHTHLAESVEEDVYCAEHFGKRPVEFMDDLGWLGDDVWLAHCVHLSDADIQRFAETGTGVAHCPTSNARLGCGIAPIADLVAAGGHVGLGVDGAASNEGGELNIELREAMYFARLRGGPGAMDPHTALSLGTHHGAVCLGRGNDTGRLAKGMLADVVLWDLNALGFAGIADPVTALVMGPQRRPHSVWVNGRRVVEGGTLTTADEHDIATQLTQQCDRLAERAGITPPSRAAAAVGSSAQ